VGVLEVSCSSRCFFGFVRKPPAFVMSFVCLLSSVYKDRKVLVLSLVDSQISSLLSTKSAYIAAIGITRVSRNSIRRVHSKRPGGRSGGGSR
jgi:hypothetical protein